MQVFHVKGRDKLLEASYVAMSFSSAQTGRDSAYCLTLYCGWEWLRKWELRAHSLTATS